MVIKLISLRNVSFEYAGNVAGRLQNINIDIADGECVLLCGRSGCGKTTILRLVNGLIPDYFDGELKGEVLYNGKNISEMEMYERAKFAGSVFQNPRTQFFNVDTDSEIAFGMENLSLPRNLMLQRNSGCRGLEDAVFLNFPAERSNEFLLRVFS